ncbi:MAG: hypothetical protein U0174_06530 [Polyangiaceae bacterium]
MNRLWPLLAACALPFACTTAAVEESPGLTEAPGAIVKHAVDIAKADRTIGRVLAQSRIEVDGASFRLTSSLNADANVTLPMHASEAFRMGDLLATQVGVVQVGANAVPGALSQGVLTYEGALPQTDLLFAGAWDGGGSFEEFLLLRDAAAPRTFSWKFDLPPGAHADLRESSLWIRSSGERLLLHVPPPFALDSRGKRIEGSLSWDATKSVLTLDLPSRADVNYPVLLDPAFEVEAWEFVPRIGTMSAPHLAFDEVRQETVILGSLFDGRNGLETWTWDGAFHKKYPVTIPEARRFSAMAYDAERKNVILFGGVAPNGRGLSDTWAWDGTNWTALAPAVRPPPAMGATLTFDPARKVLVLFGGKNPDDDTYPDATWTWNGVSWKQETTAHRPSGRMNHGLAFDPVNREVVLAGGVGSAAQPFETWTWNGSDWQQRTLSGAKPTFTTSSLAIDATRNQLMLVSTNGSAPSQVWTWGGTSWTQLAPTAAFPPRATFGLTSNPTTKKVILFGGAFDATTFSHELWTWDGAGFSKDPSSVFPDGRYHANLASLPNGQVLLFGSGYSSELQDTWLWTGQSWQPRTSPATPVSNAAPIAFVYDTARQQAVFVPPFGYFPTELWTWTAQQNWKKVIPAHSPPQRYAASSFYDPVRERLWVINGYSASGTEYRDMWGWDGVDWTPRIGANPPQLQQTGAVFDPVRSEIVLFGGTRPGGLSDQTFTWDGTTWTEKKPKVHPWARYRSTLVWDDIRKRVVLFGGAADREYTDVWAWDGSEWALLVDRDEKEAPSTHIDGSYVGLAGQGKATLFGGRDTAGGDLKADQWFFHLRGGGCTKGTECASGFCTDGVCCESNACGACQTCAGPSPGRCSPVRNADDPDTCSAKNGKTCDSEGVCRPSTGARCTRNDECATGFCVDGVCCGTSCNAPCEACAASTKVTGLDDGRCGAAKPGSNPGGRCGESAVCNALAACESRTKAFCKDARTVDLGDGTTQDCAPYTCGNGECTKKCQSARECVFPAVCSTDGRCQTPTAVGDDAGCTLRGPSGGSSGAAGVSSLMFAAGIAWRAQRSRRRRRQAASSSLNT